MRVFLTGATGFIGARIVPELLAAGHQVLGMTRSDAGAEQLAAAGAQAHRATLEDLDRIRAGAADADAVVHTAFDHDFANFLANCEKDRRVIGALGEVLKGSDRPLLITSVVGLGLDEDHRLASEEVFNAKHRNPRISSEEAGNALLDAGVNVSVVRLPQVHDTTRQGLITPLIEIARQQRRAAYVGAGSHRWPAAHVLDVAPLYRLAMERAQAGARYHAVAEEGVTGRAIAEAIAAGLGLPVESIPQDAAPAYFGSMAPFAAMDMPASSAKTRQWLDWSPTGPSLLEDLQRMDYAALG